MLAGIISLWFHSAGTMPEVEVPWAVAESREMEKVGDGVVSYSSSNEKVATVNAKTGEVKIVGAGTTTITATIKEDTEFYQYDTKTASYELEVVKPGANGGLEDYNRNDPTEL